MDKFLIAQIIGGIAMTAGVLSMQLRCGRMMMVASIPICFLWAIQYLMLAAPAGVLSNCINIMRGSVPLLKDKHLPVCTTALHVIVIYVGLHVFDSWIDALPLLAGLIANYTLTKTSNRSFVARSIMAQCALWLVYNVLVSSWMGLAAGLMTITSCTIGMARHEGWFKPAAPIIAEAAE